MTRKPPFIAQLEAVLKTFEGKTFDKVTPRFEPGLGITVHEARSPELYLESVASSIIASMGEVRGCIKEPLGARSFPDVAAVLDDHVLFFEVKSWRTARRAWAAANVNKFEMAIRKGDPIYFKTWYIDFDIKVLDHAYLIKAVSVGRIWDFTTGSKRTGSNPAYRADGPSTAAAFAHMVGWDVASRATTMSFLRTRRRISPLAVGEEFVPEPEGLF